MKTIRTFVVSSVFAIASIISATATPLQDAGRAYATGNYPVALQIWRPLAEQGDAIAQKSLARAYETGRGVQQSNHEAAYWYRKAAEKGNAFAQFMIGMMLHAGLGVEKDFSEAMKWLRLASERTMNVNGQVLKRGSNVARYTVAAMYIQGNGVEKDPVEGAKWLEMIVDHGDGWLRSGGIEFVSGDRGFIYGTDLAPFYSAEAGSGIVEQDAVEFTKWYTTTLRTQYINSAKVLGILYARGIGFAKNYAQAKEYLRQAAHKKDAEAQYLLAEVYETDREPNKPYAWIYYDLAAAAGYSDAHHRRDRVAATMTLADRRQADGFYDGLRKHFSAR